jgi:hypothetical protein
MMVYFIPKDYELMRLNVLRRFPGDLRQFCTPHVQEIRTFNDRVVSAASIILA